MTRHIDWSDLKTLSDSHTVRAIAKIKGCSRSTVTRALKEKHIEHIKHMYRETPPETLAKIKESYKTHSTYEVAKILGMPDATVKTCVRRLGIQRNRSAALKLKIKQSQDCPHDFTIRIPDGYACLICKRHFFFDEIDKSPASLYT